MNIHELRILHESSWRNSYPHFVKVLNERKCKEGVELGVAFGGHAEAILEGTGVTTLYGVDPYVHRKDYEDAMNLSQAEFDNLYWYMIGRLSRFPGYTHLRHRSVDAAGLVSGECDFVYLDADHSYAGVIEDLQLWYPKVRPGGIIAGHDYGYVDFPDVKKAVDEFCSAQRLRVMVEPRNVWWAEKGP